MKERIFVFFVHKYTPRTQSMTTTELKLSKYQLSEWIRGNKLEFTQPVQLDSFL